MCRTNESTSIQIKTITQQQVSAVSTRPSMSKHHSANKQKNAYMQTKAKKSIVSPMARSTPKIESSV